MPRPLASARPRWATLTEAEDYTGVPFRTLRRWIAQGILPGYRIGPRAVRVRLEDLDKLARRIPAAGGPARLRRSA